MRPGPAVGPAKRPPRLQAPLSPGGTPRGSPQRGFRQGSADLSVPSVSPTRLRDVSDPRSRTVPQSPKTLMGGLPIRLQGPAVGCEYRAVRRAAVRSQFEETSDQLGFLEPGDVVSPIEARPTAVRGQWRLRIYVSGVHGEAGEGWVSELTNTGLPLLEPMAVNSPAPPRRSKPTTPERSPVSQASPGAGFASVRPWAQSMYECVRPASVRAGLDSHVEIGRLAPGDRVQPQEARVDAAGQLWLRATHRRLARPGWIRLVDGSGTETLRVVQPVGSSEYTSGDLVTSKHSSNSHTTLPESTVPWKNLGPLGTSNQSASASQSLNSPAEGIHDVVSTIRDFLPLRDFLRREVNQLCGAVRESERQAEEEKGRRQNLEQELHTVQAEEGRRSAGLKESVAHAKKEAATEKQLRESVEQRLTDVQAAEEHRVLRLREEVSQAKQQAETDKQRREDVESRLDEMQQAEGQRVSELRVAVAHAEQQVEAERRRREATEQLLEMAEESEEARRAQMNGLVANAEQQAESERLRREAMERRVEEIRAAVDHQELQLRDAVAFAELQAQRELKLRENLEQQMTEAQKSEDRRRSELGAAVAQAEKAAESEAQQRQHAEQRLSQAQAAAEHLSAELQEQTAQAEAEARNERLSREQLEGQLAQVHALQSELRGKVARAEEQAQEERRARESVESQLTVAIADEGQRQKHNPLNVGNSHTMYILQGKGVVVQMAARQICVPPPPLRRCRPQKNSAGARP